MKKMVYDFLVIGATGIQGRIASRDLLQNGYSVMLAGREGYRIKNLLRKHKDSRFKYLDLRNKKDIEKIIKESGAKIIVNCADGDYNLDVTRACVKTNVNYLDLGSDDWMTAEQFELDKIMKRKGIISITGCGSTPGIVSVMAGYISEKLDSIDRIDAGFAWDANMDVFVVPYSITTIADEFSKEAHIVKAGRKKKVRPLSITMRHSLNNLKSQVSRNILHQELYTFNRSFKNKGVKDIVYYCAFPKHSFDLLMNLIELGLCNKQPVVIDGKKVRPIDITTEQLNRINIPRGYREREDLWINMYGKHNGRKKRIDMICSAGTLKGWEDATCNVDTGMPISIMAQMVYNNEIRERGSFSPELVVPSGTFFEELGKRKMFVYENGKRIN